VTTFDDITKKKKSNKKVDQKECLKEIESFTSKMQFGKPTGDATKNNCPIIDREIYLETLKRNIDKIKSRWTHPIPGCGEQNFVKFKEDVLPGYRATFHQTWAMIRFMLPNKAGLLKNSDHIIEQDIGLMIQGKDIIC